MENKIKNILIVDVTERGNKLITDYNTVLGTNEDQKKFTLQVVKDHRKNIPIQLKKI